MPSVMHQLKNAVRVVRALFAAADPCSASILASVRPLRGDRPWPAAIRAAIEIAIQVPLDFNVTARPYPGFLTWQVHPSAASKVSAAAIRRSSRSAAGRNRDALARAAWSRSRGPDRADRRRVAERDAALLGAKFVLVHPSARAGDAQAQPKAPLDIIKRDDLGPTGRQGQGFNDPLCELHVSLVVQFWEDHGKICAHASSCVLLRSLGR